jgi:dimeric dUTPase (all-alpha-NTP-PPase superfamily)
MKQQISTMLDLQDSMNSKVKDDWREQNFEWYRAIWIECAELLDHHGWKWWKKQQPDVNQIALELVDIWHFGLSLLLLKDQSQDVICDSVVTAFNDGFVGLAKGINMQFDQLYIAYVGKNVLNFFRQDHGYQDGSYHKQWGGREDNEHLVEIVAKLDTNLPSFKDDLYAEMKAVYEKLCK